jgi:lipopolysaccharide transport system permease protein
MLKSRQHYLEVISVLAEKDFKVRYRNSVLGFFWSLLNPLATMVILTVVFSILLRINIPNFAAWALLGLLLWRFFALGTSQALGTILGNPSLVTKVYLPRYIIVLANNIANLFGSSLEFVALLPLLVLLGVKLNFYALLIVPIFGMEFLLIFGLSLLLSSLNVKYRDFYQIWDIALQLGFWLCPIVYDITLIPSRYQFLYSLNPVTRLIDTTRNAFLYHKFPSLFDVAIVMTSAAILLLAGFGVFKRLEARMAEEL